MIKNPLTKLMTLMVNKDNSKRILVQCSNEVRRDAVRRETIDGVEHIIVSSMTLPDDIVMNGGLYPAEEVAKSYMSLERTLAPVEHPMANGQFISATDPVAIHNYHAGAFNMNVRRENGRVHIDKYINVAEANKSERGKRLLDRINELETSDNPRAIHTSTGVYCQAEVLAQPMTNALNQEYTWVARNMQFDHDAILLDTVAAAQPNQGVGMAVNMEGKKCDVVSFLLTNTVSAATTLPLAPTDHAWDKSAADKRVRDEIGAEDEPNATYKRYHLWFDAADQENFGAYKLPFVDIIDGVAHAVPNALRNAASRLGQTDGPSDAEKTRIQGVIDRYLNRIRNNEQSISDMSKSVNDALQHSAIAAEWIEELFPDRVVFWSHEQLFEVPYTVDAQGLTTIVGIPLPVERDVTYIPKTNSEVDTMKQLIVNALQAAGIDTDKLSDDQLMQKYDELKANKAKSDDEIKPNTDVDAFTAALAPLTARLESIETSLKSNGDAELTKLATVVANNVDGLGVDSAKLLGLDKLKEMAAKYVPSFGISPVVNSDNSDTRFNAPAEMPE